MVLTDSEVASLKSVLRCWEWFGYASTAVVGLGCIGEFIAEFTALAKSESCRHKLARLSLIVLIFGIAGELLSAARTSQLSGQIIANIEERAANAGQKAGEANDRAAGNEKEAKRLAKLAEDERLARVQLERKVAWRKIDEQSQDAIASDLVQFSKEPSLVSYNPQDIEAESFASDITTALHKAEWGVFDAMPVLAMREGPLPFGTNPKLDTGVHVWSTDDETSRKAATALVKQLSSRGFDAVMSAEAKGLLGIHPTSTRVVVSVEHKPEGPQGEFKLQAEKEAKNKGTINAK
jgi:hypothetical protein